jgi:hypothetical protein
MSVLSTHITKARADINQIIIWHYYCGGIAEPVFHDLSSGWRPPALKSSIAQFSHGGEGQDERFSSKVDIIALQKLSFAGSLRAD